jgi:hypothetical protein
MLLFNHKLALTRLPDRPPPELLLPAPGHNWILTLSKSIHPDENGHFFRIRY